MKCLTIQVFIITALPTPPQRTFIAQCHTESEVYIDRKYFMKKILDKTTALLVALILNPNLFITHAIRFNVMSCLFYLNVGQFQAEL